jgi:hypothetical protein
MPFFSDTTLTCTPDSVRLHVHNRLSLLRLHHGAGIAHYHFPRYSVVYAPADWQRDVLNITHTATLFAANKLPVVFSKQIQAKSSDGPALGHR